MKRGRPAGSPVRQNIMELLSQFGELHGYGICKHYLKLFPKVTKRAIYYSLRKGAKKGFFKVARVEKHASAYSWGPEAQRVYYALGELAKPAGDANVKKYYESIEPSAKASNSAAAAKKEKKPRVSILNLKPSNWGKGTERVSEEIDTILYQTDKSAKKSQQLTSARP